MFQATRAITRSKVAAALTMTKAPSQIHDSIPASRYDFPDMHPILEAFNGYWHALRGTRDIPLFLDFNINDVPVEALPYMSLIKVEQKPMRFSFRLAGTSLAAAYREDLTGKYLDELDHGGNEEDYRDDFVRVAQGRAINSRKEGFFMQDGTRYEFEGSLYPFEGVRGNVSRIIIVSVDDYERAKQGQERLSHDKG